MKQDPILYRILSQTKCNIRIYLQLGVWGLKTDFGLIGQEAHFKYSQTRPHFIQNPEENLMSS